MEIINYIKRALMSDKTHRDTTESLTGSLKTLKLELPKVAASVAGVDLELQDSLAIKLDRILRNELGLSSGLAVGLLAPALGSLVPVIEGLLNQIKIMERAKPNMAWFSYNPQGAFIDRASVHIEFLLEYYIDVTRYMLADLANNDHGIAKAPAHQRELLGLVFTFVKLLDWYSSVRDISQVVSKIPDVSIPTADDIETAAAVYRPGVLDPLIAVTLHTAFFPVRVALELRAEYRANKYRGLKEKLDSLNMMIVMLSGADTPGIDRELESIEGRIKDLERLKKEMEVTVGIL